MYLHHIEITAGARGEIVSCFQSKLAAGGRLCEQPLVGEERYVTTRITAAKETTRTGAARNR